MVKEKEGTHLLLEFEPGRTLVNKRQMDLGSTTMVQEFLTKDEWLGMRDSQAEFNKVLSSAPKKEMVDELRNLAITLNKQSRVKSVTFRVEHQKKNLFGRKETVKLYAQVRKPVPGAPTLVADSSTSGSNGRLSKSHTNAGGGTLGNDNSPKATEEQTRRGSAAASLGGSAPQQPAPSFAAAKKQAPATPAQKNPSPQPQQPRSPQGLPESDSQYMNRMETQTSNVSNTNVPDDTDEGLYQNFTQSRPNSGAQRTPAPQAAQQQQPQPHQAGPQGDSDYVNIDYDGNGANNVVQPAPVQEQDEYMNFEATNQSQVKPSANDIMNGTTASSATSAGGEDVDAYMSYPDQKAVAAAEDDGEYIMYDPKQKQDQSNPIIGEGSAYMNVGKIQPGSPVHTPSQVTPQVAEQTEDGADLYMNYQEAQKAQTDKEQVREGVAAIVLSPSVSESHSLARPVSNSGTLKSQKSTSSIDPRTGKPTPMARPRPASRPRPQATEATHNNAQSSDNAPANSLMHQVSQTASQGRTSPLSQSRASPKSRPGAGAQLFTLDGPTLEKSSCFHGFSTDTSRGDRRRAIEDVMDHKPTGCWLLRHDSRGERFVLVVRYIDRTLHIPVDANAGGQFSIDVDKWFDSVEALLGHYHSHELSSTISTMLTNAVRREKDKPAEPEPDEVDGYFVMSPKARKGV